MNETAAPFVLFSTYHLVTLGLIALASFALPLAVRGRPALHQPVANAFAITLLIIQSWKILHRALYLDQSILLHLPLHICGISTFLVAIMLLRRSFSFYEVLIFWGLGATPQAILTPNLEYAFPHPQYFGFFITHGMIIVGVLYATLVFDFRPTWKSFGKGILALNLYALFVTPFNLFLDANYLFLRAKPAGASLMDSLGPWPWYLIPLEFLGAFFFLLVFGFVKILDKIFPVVETAEAVNAASD